MGCMSETVARLHFSVSFLLKNLVGNKNIRIFAEK